MAFVGVYPIDIDRRERRMGAAKGGPVGKLGQVAIVGAAGNDEPLWFCQSGQPNTGVYPCVHCD